VTQLYPYCKTEGALHSHYIMCYSENWPHSIQTSIHRQSAL